MIYTGLQIYKNLCGGNNLEFLKLVMTWSYTFLTYYKNFNIAIELFDLSLEIMEQLKNSINKYAVEKIRATKLKEIT